jgi:diguanylate cyclase (GGDEF)-like protein
MTAGREPIIEELSSAELGNLDHDTLVQRCTGLQRALVSLLNANSLYKRQLSASREHTLRSGQIADLSRKLNIADTGVIAEVAVEDLARFFGAGYAALFLYDNESNLLALHSASRPVDSQIALNLEHDDDVMSVNALLHRSEPVIIRNLEHYESIAGREMRMIPAEEPLRNGGMICPLAIGTSDEKRLNIGVLLFGDRDEPFGHNEAEIATMMSEMIGTAISTAQLLERLSELAETDGLTKLYNHRHFQQELDRAIASASRYENPMTLAMMDIDHFKTFNDKHGHQAGDHVLREVSRLIRLSVRDTVDIVARYGGEEFAVIMPNTGVDGGVIAMERLRACIEATAFHIGSQTLSVTISIGLAEYAKGQDKSAFVDSADMALYRSKRNGRNRVEAAAKEQFG